MKVYLTYNKIKASVLKAANSAHWETFSFPACLTKSPPAHSPANAGHLLGAMVSGSSRQAGAAGQQPGALGSQSQAYPGAFPAATGAPPGATAERDRVLTEKAVSGRAFHFHFHSLCLLYQSSHFLILFACPIPLFQPPTMSALNPKSLSLSLSLSTLYSLFLSG